MKHSIQTKPNLLNTERKIKSDMRFILVIMTALMVTSLIAMNLGWY